MEASFQLISAVAFLASTQVVKYASLVLSICALNKLRQHRRLWYNRAAKQTEDHRKRTNREKTAGDIDKSFLHFMGVVIINS